MPAFLYALLAVVLLTAVAIAGTVLREKHRARKMTEAALRFGFSYAADGGHLLGEGLAALPLFVMTRLPRNSEVRNVLEKRIGGTELFICDYHYWTGGSTKGRFDHDQTVACFRLGQPALPDFTLHRQPRRLERNLLRAGLKMAGFPARMGSSSFQDALGVLAASAEDPGIQCSSHPDFTERYWLKSQSHADETRALFSAELIGFLEQLPAPLCIESAGRWLAIYRKDIKVRPDEIGPFGEEAAQVLRMLLKAKERAAAVRR